MDPIYLRKLLINRQLKQNNLQTQKSEQSEPVDVNAPTEKNVAKQAENIANNLRSEFVNPRAMKMNYLASMERANYVKNVMNLPKTLPELIMQLQNESTVAEDFTNDFNQNNQHQQPQKSDIREGVIRNAEKSFKETLSENNNLAKTVNRQNDMLNQYLQNETELNRPPVNNKRGDMPVNRQPVPHENVVQPDRAMIHDNKQIDTQRPPQQPIQNDKVIPQDTKPQQAMMNNKVVPNEPKPQIINDRVPPQEVKPHPMANDRLQPPPNPVVDINNNNLAKTVNRQNDMLNQYLQNETELNKPPVDNRQGDMSINRQPMPHDNMAPPIQNRMVHPNPHVPKENVPPPHQEFRAPHNPAMINHNEIMPDKAPIDKNIPQGRYQPPPRGHEHIHPHHIPQDRHVEAEAAAATTIMQNLQQPAEPTITQMRQRLSGDAAELFFTGLINLNDLSETLQANSKSAKAKLVLAMANASKQGIDNSQINDTLKMLTASMAASDAQTPSKILKNIIELYLPWYPLQQGVGFNLAIDTQPNQEDYLSILKVWIQTKNYGNVNSVLTLLNSNTVDMNIQCSQDFPKDDLLKRLNSETTNHTMQSNIVVEELAVREDYINPQQQAQVNLSSTYELNPYLLLMAHSFIKNTIVIDNNITMS